MNRNLDQQLRPPLQVFRLDIPHPSECRGFAYLQDMRELAVQNRLNGTDEDPAIRLLQDQHKYPHPISVDRFFERHEEVGHSRAYRRTGNKRAEREVEGINLIQLALYRSFCPKATLPDVNAYLFQINL